jgi:hypothetical protein
MIRLGPGHVGDVADHGAGADRAEAEDLGEHGARGSDCRGQLLRGVIFDMDGVVVDSGPLSMTVIAEIIGEHGGHVDPALLDRMEWWRLRTQRPASLPPRQLACYVSGSARPLRRRMTSGKQH